MGTFSLEGSRERRETEAIVLIVIIEFHYLLLILRTLMST